MFKLYYAAGGCSIATHITLREVGASFELHTVDLRRKQLEDGRDFTTISPKGQIPALILEDGALLTEGAVIVQYLADLAPARGLAPPAGTMARVRLQEWLSFLATELHKQLQPLIRKDGDAAYRATQRERVRGKLAFVVDALADRPYLLGDAFTVADAYLFYVLRAWQRQIGEPLPPSLTPYYQRLVDRPTIKAALLSEGLQP